MSSPGTGMPSLMDVYNTIKAQEAHFPIPQTTGTYLVGTFDALHGRFTYAVPTYTKIERDTGDPNIPGGPVKPVPGHITRVTGGRISAVNVQNVVLQFNVINRQGRDFVLSVAGFPAVHAPQGQDFVTLNVVQASRIVEFTLTCGTSFTSTAPLEINYQMVGAGAFTIPALPVSIIYAPPVDQNQRNTASWSFNNTTGTSVTLLSKTDSSTKAPDPQFNTPAGLSSAIQLASQGLQKLASDAEKDLKDIADKLGVIGSAIALIPKIIGQTTITGTVASSSSNQQVLSLTFSQQQTVTTSAASGGPGSGDKIYYLVNARLCWFFHNRTLQLALLGYDRVAPITVEFLKNQGAQSGLPATAIQALLALDPFVSAGVNLPQQRFEPIVTAEINGGEWKYTETYTFNQQDTNTTMQSNTTVTDMQAGWLSFLGIGPSKTETDTVALSFSTATQNSVSRTITNTVDLFAGPTEIYSVEIYVDVIFGTFAYRSVPIPAAAKLAGTVHDSLNKPMPFAEITVINNGRRFVTRANAHGRYAFHSAGITPGHTIISSGHAQAEVSFVGQPLGNLNLKTAVRRTA